jgi:hypothetical protein
MYRLYQRLMVHWQRVVDVPILDVHYEELTADQEAVTRRIIEFCGLEWDAECLRYYESGRVAATLSYDQVNKPMYRTSVKRADRFGANLDPLRKALHLSGDPSGPPCGPQ